MRIEPQGFFYIVRTLIRSAPENQGAGHRKEVIDVVGIEGDGALRLGDGFIVQGFMHEHPGSYLVGEGRRALQGLFQVFVSQEGNP